jgi:hypothetical protein
MSAKFPVFAVTFAAVYAVVYYFAVDDNLALFSYGPAVGEWTLFTRAASSGPTMYWYGWIATSALAGAAAGLLACLLPDNIGGIGKRFWPDLAWLVPLCSIAAIGYLLSGYLTR